MVWGMINNTILILSDASTQDVSEDKLLNHLEIHSSEALNEIYDEVAKNIRDKDTRTYYRSVTVQTNPWVEVNFNTKVYVSFVMIVNRLDCPDETCSTRLENTRVEALGSARALKRACGIVVGVDGYDVGRGTEAEETYFVNCRGSPARKIRLTDMDSEMAIAEVQVFKAEKGMRPNT